MPRNSGVNEAYFSWKYERNPYIADPLLALVFVGDELVAMRGIYGSLWHPPDGGPARVVPHADDLFVSPEHRDRGLFLLVDKELHAAAHELGSSIMISMSASPTTQKVAAAAGWQTVTTFDRRLRLGSHVRAPTTDMTRFGGGTRWVVRKARGALRRTGRGFVEAPSSRRSDAALLGVDGAHPRVSVTDTVDIGSMAELAIEPVHGRWVPDRGASFYRWRLGNPDRTYRCIVWSDDRVRGFLLLALMPHRASEVKIIDHGAEDASILVDMLGAVASGQHCNIEVLDAVVGGVPGEVLDDFGFRRAPARDLLTDRSFMVRSTFRGGGTHADDRWMFGLIDSMLA